jgi:putative transposase
LNPDLHRRSIRLKGYDYAQAGAYFVTVVTQNRECLFGGVSQGEFVPNQAGIMIKNWWLELTHKFPKIEIDYYCVMPNHFHGIIVIVGADLRVCPPIQGAHAGAPLQKEDVPLSEIIQWFKTMTTNEFIRGVKQSAWIPFKGKLWQRNYYEHIIRGEGDLNAIREYILGNPVNWLQDEENPLG